MSLRDPSISEFMDRVKGDNPDWASLSNDEIKQKFTDARDNASGFGADIKRTASQAALDYIEEFEKNGGTAQDAIKKLDDLSRGGNGDAPLLKNGRINPEILDGAKPPEAAPSAPEEGEPSNTQEPDVPPEPEIIVEAPEDVPSSGGIDKTIADAIGSLSPEGQMQLMIGALLAPIALLEGGDTLSNFLENMPPEIAEMLEQFIPPEMAEAIFGAVGLTDANVSVAGTGNMLSALRGDTPAPTPEQPAPVMQADLQQVPTPGYMA